MKRYILFIITTILFLCNILFAIEIEIRKKKYWYLNLWAGEIGYMQPYKDELPYIAVGDNISYVRVFPEKKLGINVSILKCYLGLKESEYSDYMCIVSMHGLVTYVCYFPKVKLIKNTDTSYLEGIDN
ncbi:unnamed protein product, partial [marine sediment metagenome]